MALKRIQFAPGITKESTSYANEGTFYDANWARFRSGYAEKIGGWVNQAFSKTYKGIARNLWNWITNSSENMLGIGTSQKYYIDKDGLDYYDITPLRTGAVSLGASPISVTNGSKVVTITAASHSAVAGTYITITSTASVGGLNISGEYEIVEIIDANTYTISSPTAASSTAAGGGTVTVTYQINAGSSSVISGGSGWGLGPWGNGSWGQSSGSSTGPQIRLWSHTNFGQDLLICPRNGEIYYWTLDTSTYARAITLEEKANLTGKFSAYGSSAGAGTSIVLEDVSGVNVGSVVISGTNIANPGVDYVVSVNLGTRTVTLSSATTGAASGVYLFSYSGRYVPQQAGLIVSSEVSKFIVALGATPYDPTNFNTTYNPLLVRWSDQENAFEWVPEVTNQSGEQILSNGSYLVTAQTNRQEILIWSDSAIYSMQYLGPPFVFGFNLLMDNISIASPNSAITAANVTYWMGVDKFYVYTGRVETLPCTLRNYVFNDINRGQIDQVVSGTNEGYSEVWWFYPSANSQVNDRYVIYNYLEKVWYYGSLNRTGWLDSPLRSGPMGAFSIQNTYIDIDINDSTDIIQGIDVSSYPTSGTLLIDSEEISYSGLNVNSQQFTGCTRGVNGTTAASHLRYSAITYLVNNQIMIHETGNDDYSSATPVAIRSYVSSADFDIEDGNQFGFVWRMLPDLTFSGSTGASPVVTMTVEGRQNSGNNYVTADSPSVTRTAVIPVEQYTGEIFTRVRGRQMRFTLDSNSIGVAWQMGAMRIDLRSDGRQ